MVARYYLELLNHFTRQTGQRDTAADVVHDAYARVLTLERAGTAVAQPRALLYQTARHLLVDRWRRQATRAPQSDEAPVGPDELAAPAHTEPEVALESAQTVAALVATIDALPPRCREAFVLHRFDGLSHAEVAGRMGISRKAVEHHIERAMRDCRRCRATWGL